MALPISTNDEKRSLDLDPATDLSTPRSYFAKSLASTALRLFVAALLLTACHDLPSLIQPVRISLRSLVSTRMRANEIAWQPCADIPEQHCGYLSVPLDYAPPLPSETVSVALRRIPAVAEVKDRLPPILLNPGGPGVSGHAMVALFGGEIAVILQGRRDIIGFDPRGVNMTTPSLGCYDYDDEEERSAYNERLLGLPFEARGGRNASSRAEEAFFRRFDAHLQKRTLACQTEGNQKMLRASSTALVARDMKRIMEALGEEKLSFYGFSYGTALGATFAAMFPNLVDRFVLDGVSDAAAYHRDYGTRRWAEGSMVDTNKVFQGFLETCAGAGYDRCALARHGSTAHSIRQRYEDLLDHLAYQPLAVAASDLGAGVLTASDLQYIMHTTLYRPSAWPLVAAAIASAERGNGTDLLNLAQHHFSRHRSSNKNVFHRPLSLSTSMFATTAIHCADSAVNLTFAEDGTVDRLPNLPALTRHLESMSVSGGLWSLWLATCKRWPYTAIERYDGPWSREEGLNKTAFPILFIGVSADPVTPLASARLMAQRFGNDSATLLIHDGFGHCAAAHPSLCTAQAVRAYFNEGVVPSSGTICKADAGFLFPPGSSGTKVAIESEDDTMLRAMRRIGEHL